jgi:hypothetical protein
MSEVRSLRAGRQSVPAQKLSRQFSSTSTLNLETLNKTALQIGVFVLPFLL